MSKEREEQLVLPFPPNVVIPRPRGKDTEYCRATDLKLVDCDVIEESVTYRCTYCGAVQKVFLNQSESSGEKHV